MTLKRKTENFWDFSLSLYGNEEVANMCLDLQDRFAVDVNMLLFCCWQAVTGRETDPAALRVALDFSNKWNQQVVQPLRGSRRWMKTVTLVNPGLLNQHDQLRQQIKRNELAAERLQQEQLQYLVDKQTKAFDEVAESSLVTAIADTNLCNYLQMAGIELDPVSREQLHTMLSKYLINYL